MSTIFAEKKIPSIIKLFSVFFFFYTYASQFISSKSSKYDQKTNYRYKRTTVKQKQKTNKQLINVNENPSGSPSLSETSVSNLLSKSNHPPPIVTNITRPPFDLILNINSCSLQSEYYVWIPEDNIIIQK